MRSLMIAAVIAGLAATAGAQSASTQAQSLFDEGRRLMKAGKVTEACAAFESSQKLDPAVTTLLNLATCRETNKQYATAWGLFADANRAARAASNDKLAKVATSHAKKLEPRLSKLTITVAADRQVTGLVITRGNDPVDPASFNHALPIDGGTYTITAKAPGRVTWTASKTIKVEGDNQTLEVPMLAPDPKAPVARVEPRPTTPTPPPATVTGTADIRPNPARQAAPRGHSNLVPIAVGAGALVLGGAALGFHLSGNSQYDKAKAEMEDQQRRDDLERSANNRRYVAEALGVAAIGAAGVAVFLYVRGRGEHRSDATAIAPVASPTMAGLALSGSFD
jgi:hypothetical protein